MPWIEGEAAEPLVKREGGEALVGQRRAGADAVARLANRLAEPFRRQPDHHPVEAAIADEEIRADADDGHRHRRIEALQEEREVVGIGRLEQHRRPPADPEPGERRDLRIAGDTAANGGDVARAAVLRTMSFGA